MLERSFISSLHFMLLMWRSLTTRSKVFRTTSSVQWICYYILVCWNSWERITSIDYSTTTSFEICRAQISINIDFTAISATHEAPISVLVKVYAIYFSFICLWVFAMATKYSEVVFTKKNLYCTPAGYFSILYV